MSPLTLREVRVRSRQKLRSGLMVLMPSWPGRLTSDTWLPLINGTGADLGANTAAVFRFAGASSGNCPLLALPMVSRPLPGGRARLVIATNPYFSTRFQADAVEWTCLAKAGLGEEPRTIVVAAHPGSIEDAIGWFFRGVLPEIAPGPAWLHQIAFLTSDCLGAAYGEALKAPYALVSHGTYQDSWCQPRAWSYGVFANCRNVLWSCCWWPVSKWSWIEFGVREYQAPVAISNGWGDDKGFSELTPAQRERVLELFNWRKRRPTRLKWFARLPSEPGE